jgi:hypothetical protein
VSGKLEGCSENIGGDLREIRKTHIFALPIVLLSHEWNFLSSGYKELNE